jgi:hypothetical protein
LPKVAGTIFNLFKDSKAYFKRQSKCIADSGYQGIQKVHANSELPKKRVKRGHWPKTIKKKINEYPPLG